MDNETLRTNFENEKRRNKSMNVFQMQVESVERSSTSSRSRISLALLLTILIVFPDGMAFAATYTCSGTTPWHTSGATLPHPLETFGAAVNGSRMYVIGGYDNVDVGAPTNVYHKALSAITTSTVSNNWFSNSLWKDPNNPTEIVGLSRDLCGKIYTSSTSGTSYLYTVGGVYYDAATNNLTGDGKNHGVTTDQVWFAAINSSNGNLGTWIPTSSLPVALQLHGSVIMTVGTNTYLYVIGGSTYKDDSNPSADVQKTVYYAEISPTDGSVGAWMTLPSIPSPGTGWYKTCPVVANGRIYVSGGEDSGTALDNVVYATPSTTNGSFTAWTDNSSNYIKIGTTLVTDAPQAVVYFNGAIDLIAGDQTGSGNNTNCVFQGAVNASTGAVTWSTPSTISPFPINVSRNTGTSSSTNIFSLGGLTGSAGNDTTAIYYWP
jgi:hypothetical protein